MQASPLNNFLSGSAIPEKFLEKGSCGISEFKHTRSRTGNDSS